MTETEARELTEQTPEHIRNTYNNKIMALGYNIGAIPALHARMGCECRQLGEALPNGIKMIGVYWQGYLVNYYRDAGPDEEIKKRFGGRQEGAGRPELAPDEKTVQREISWPPKVLAAIIADVGDSRGSVARQVISIVRNHYGLEAE